MSDVLEERARILGFLDQYSNLRPLAELIERGAHYQTEAQVRKLADELGILLKQSELAA